MINELTSLLAGVPTVPTLLLLGLSIALSAAVTGVAVSRYQRRGHSDTARGPGTTRWERGNDQLMTLFVLSATGISLEGMWHVLTGETVGMPTPLALGVVGMYETGMYLFGRLARGAIAKNRAVWPFVLVVWVLAVVAGLIASLPTAYEAAERLLRLGAPVAAAITWSTVIGIKWSEAQDRGQRQRTRLRVTPRRLAIRWGLVEAGEEDLAGLSTQQHVRRLIRASDRLADSRRDGWLRRYRQHRLRQLVYAATPELVDQAQQRRRGAADLVAHLTPDSRVSTGLDIRTGHPDTEVDTDRTSGWTPERTPTGHPGGHSSGHGPDTEATGQGTGSMSTGQDRGHDTGHPGGHPSGHQPGTEVITPAAPRVSTARAEATKAQVRELVVARPELTQADIASLLGVSSKTVQRHLKDLNGSVTASR